LSRDIFFLVIRENDVYLLEKALGEVMELTDIFGLGFLVLGFVSISSYSENLASFRLPLFYKELKPMQERWGTVPGTVLHIMSYTIAPLGFGLLLLMGVVGFS
jgi:hypothetical protein